MKECYQPLDYALRMLTRRETERNIFDDDEDAELIYSLDHQYTDANFSLKNLKGVDQARAQALLFFADKFQFSMYLATFECSISGACDENDDDHDWDRYGGGWDRPSDDEDEDNEDSPEPSRKGNHFIEEELDREVSLRRVVDLNGDLLVQGVPTSQSRLLLEFDYDDREPDDEDFEGYTGNAGASATHWYRDAVSNTTLSTSH